MFDIGWMELLVIGVVALIVIGPKDLPEMFRQLGRFTGKLRGMAREFQRAMDQAAKESGVGDVAKDLKTMTSPKNLGLDAVKSAADRFEKWDPMKNAARPSNPAAVGGKALEVKLPPNPVNSMAATAAVVPAEAGASEPVPATPLPFSAASSAKPGSATAALAEKQAAKRAVLAETAEKLRAIESGALPAEPPKRSRKSAAKAAEPVPEPGAVAAAKKPRAPRKPKAPDA